MKAAKMHSWTVGLLTLTLAVVAWAQPQSSDASSSRALKSAWLKTHAAETLNAMIGQHKEKAQGRQKTLESFMKSNNMLDDFESSDYSKKSNPNNLSFHQLYRGALQSEASQGLPSVPKDTSLDQMQRLEKASIQMAKQNFQQLQPLLKKNNDMIAYIKSKDQWDAYEKYAGQAVQQQKQAYQKWLEQAKEKKAEDQPKVDADRRKAILAINDRERQERANNLQKQLQVAQTIRQNQLTRYTVDHYHPSYSWGDPYSDSPWRYRGRGFNYGNGGNVTNVDAQPQGMFNASNSAMQESNEQLNQSQQQLDASRKRERDAENKVIDDEAKEQSDEDEAKDQMPDDTAGASDQAVVPPASTPARVTEDANKAAARQVPPPAPEASPNRPQQPAEQPEQPAAQPQEQPQEPAQPQQ